jgi:ATP-binding cassette subfamily C protein CydD
MNNIGRRLLQYIPHIRLYIALMLVIALLSGLFIVAQAQYIAQIINQVFLFRQGLAQVAFPLLALLLVVVGRAVLPWGNDVVTNLASTRAKTTMRQRLLDHLYALGPAYTQGERSGELANTLVDGAEALDAYFNQLLPQILATACIPVVVLALVLWLDPLSGLILLITAPLLPFLLFLVGKRADTLTKRQWSQMSLLSAHFLDVMQGLTTLKLFGRSKLQSKTIERMSERFRQVTMRVLRVAFLSSFVMEFGATISIALVAVEIGIRLLYSGIPFYQAFLVLLLAPEFYAPLRAMGTQFHASMNSTAVAERMFAILDQPLPVQPSTSDAQPALHERLQIEHVHYTYPEQEHPALVDVSLQIERGQKVALVGPSGAGKSTLAHLLLRFIEPQQGQVLADGVTALACQPQDWRKLVAWVPQRPYLFNASLAENIRLGSPDASLEAVVEAAKNAHLHEFIQSLPQGYDTVIGERGARLSGGQIQRLSLARAFLKDAPLLILDEATSNLDNENEELVLAAMKKLMADRMSLVIAHRLNTVMDADQIVVLDAGRVIGMGTHQELLHTSPLYGQLVSAYKREESVQ